MSIIGSFNGWNIVGLPCDTTAGVRRYSSIEWDPQEVVSVNTSPFTGQTQTYDWQASWWEGTLSFTPMYRASADAWAAFILECRGQSNVFSVGDPKGATPRGTPVGTPVINGAAQTGYALATRGWTASAANILLPGDYIQIGYRLYRVLDAASADSSGHATLAVWPNLRDQPADGATIITASCKGLFRLKQNAGNKWSTNPGSYGFTGIQIREAL